MSAASFTAIGAFSDVALGFFDRDKKGYKHIPLDEQVAVRRPLTVSADEWESRSTTDAVGVCHA